MPDRLEPAPATNGATSVGAISPEERKQRLVKLVEAKVDQGYVVESQTDSEAVLTTRGRTRWFGLRGRTDGQRRSISVDEQGNPKTRRI